MSKRHRLHINPLKLPAMIPREPLEIPAGPQVEIELGCGDGRFIIERAMQYPDRLFFGLDIREAFLGDGRKAIATLGLDNVSLETCNLIVDSGHLFGGQGRIARFFINFPDPWFKSGQRNRRWFASTVCEDLARALQPAGELFYQTDVWSIAIDALALLESNPLLRNVVGEWAFCPINPFGVESSRDLSCQRSGRKIWRIHFLRIDDGEPNSADDHPD
jgi:tRNA (guanine-N7-)-methyltransferase